MTVPGDLTGTCPAHPFPHRRSCIRLCPFMDLHRDKWAVVPVTQISHPAAKLSHPRGSAQRLSRGAFA